MAETVTIYFNTQAQTQGITTTIAGLTTVKQGVEQLGRNFGSLALKIAAFAAPLTALISTGAFSRFTKEAIDNADAMGKAAQGAGMTVREFSTIAHAANLANIESHKLSMGIARLSEWMVKSGQGGRNVIDVLLEQADTFAVLEDNAYKTTLAMERFGSHKGIGQTMIPLLNQGSAALREQIREAEMFGLIVGPGFTRRAQEFNDNITRIRGLLRGLFNRIAEGVLPGLIELTTSVISWGRENAERIGLFLQDAVAMTVRAYKESRLGELISLLVEIGIREGGEVGGKALSFLFGKLFSVEFVMLAANAGRLLAEGLLRAVKLPVDAFGSGMEFVVVNIGTLLGKTMVSVLNAVFAQAAAALNLSTLPLRAALKIDSVKAPELEFKGPSVPAFGQIFAEHQKASQESIDAILSLMDQQIEKSRQLLTDGQISEDQAQGLISARERLAALYDREVKARQEAAAADAKIDGKKIAPSQKIEDLTDLRNSLERSATQIKLIELDVTLSAQQKNKELREAYRERLEMVEKMRTALDRVVQEGAALGPAGITEAHTKAVKELNGVLIQQAEIQKQLFDLDQDTFFGRFEAGLKSWSDSLKTFGASVADIMLGGVKSAIDTVANGIWNIVDGTATWGDMFRQVGRQILSQLISIALQQIVVRGLMLGLAAVMEMVGAIAVATHMRTFVAGAMAGAGTSSAQGGWVGLLIYMGVLAAAIASITAMSGGFQEGGIIEGGPQMIRVNEDGRRESVLNARATAMLGADRIAALNAGMMDYESRVAASVAPPADSGAFASSAGSDRGSGFAPSGGMSPGSSQPMTLNILLVDSRNAQAARDWAVSSDGQTVIAEVIKNQKLQIGLT